MQNYSVESKEATIKKMLPPLSMSVSELMRMEGIPRGTLYSWRTAGIKKEQPVPENEQKNRLKLPLNHLANSLL
jgi:transposase-like protein